MSPKPLLYLLDGTSVNQCWAMLPFHHGNYVVANCHRREGHDGTHECNVYNCLRQFPQTKEV